MFSFNKYPVLEMCQALWILCPYPPRTLDLREGGCILNNHTNDYIMLVVLRVLKQETCSEIIEQGDCF